MQQTVSTHTHMHVQWAAAFSSSAPGSSWGLGDLLKGTYALTVDEAESTFSFKHPPHMTARLRQPL